MNFDSSLQNKYLNQDSTEYIIVNENSSAHSQITKSHSPSTPPHSLVVNKLYDISSKTDNEILNHCNSTCKCDVEIHPGTDGLGISIQIKDCYCNQLNSVSNNNNNNHSNALNKNQPTMVENPDYLDTPCIPSMAPIETGFEDDMCSDLLDFAVQIANGMVSTSYILYLVQKRGI